MVSLCASDNFNQWAEFSKRTQSNNGSLLAISCWNQWQPEQIWSLTDIATSIYIYIFIQKSLIVSDQSWTGWCWRYMLRHGFTIRIVTAIIMIIIMERSSLFILEQTRVIIRFRPHGFTNMVRLLHSNPPTPQALPPTVLIIKHAQTNSIHITVTLIGFRFMFRAPRIIKTRTAIKWTFPLTVRPMTTWMITLHWGQIIWRSGLIMCFRGLGVSLPVSCWWVRTGWWWIGVRHEERFTI